MVVPQFWFGGIYIEERVFNYAGIDYIVSSDGKLYSTHSNGRGGYHKEISQRLNSDGYQTVTVGPTGHRLQARVHRIVAECFIPNPNNLPEVNHIDCNRMNNDVSNLEWVSHNDNVRHSYNLGKYKGRFGDKNPNYGNHTLSEKYRNNPDLSKEKNSRPGTQNGRCVKMKLTNTKTGEVILFDYIGQAASYLIEHGYSKGTVRSTSGVLWKAMRNGTLCYRIFSAEKLK